MPVMLYLKFRKDCSKDTDAKSLATFLSRDRTCFSYYWMQRCNEEDNYLTGIHIIP